MIYAYSSQRCVFMYEVMDNHTINLESEIVSAFKLPEDATYVNLDDTYMYLWEEITEERCS
jgi:hypothetical protein